MSIVCCKDRVGLPALISKRVAETVVHCVLQKHRGSALYPLCAVEMVCVCTMSIVCFRDVVGLHCLHCVLQTAWSALCPFCAV